MRQVRRPTRPGSAVERIAGEIMSYLDQHPRAADTASGIRRWWLPAEERVASEGAVSEALELLRARGLVNRTMLGDGSALYARAPGATGRQ